MNPDDLVLAAEHLAGFVIVMMALAVLWGLTALVGRAFTPAVAAIPAPVADLRPPSPAVGDEVIVIAAVAAALLGGPLRIVSVRPVPTSWALQGRREIHASHRIR